ncbi:hypothetical protein Slin15195_G019920 [Septoria linicola]|uniref:Uncharacterized protein n=1 Tax=Septoria linicola TaxID=215465 RepID=A0A9Q9AM73_9PEZI|nr:hypothetical protein Slin15195_G019920 [Septoria linicola]
MPKRRAIAPEASSKGDKLSSNLEVADLHKPQAGSTSTPSSFLASDGSSTISVAVQAKLQRLRTSRDDGKKYELQIPIDPNHIVVSSTALLGALMTLYADWEIGLDPAHVDLEALKDIIIDGMPDEADSLEQWWNRNGEVVVDLAKNGDLKIEQDVRSKFGSKVEDVGLLRFEVEEYYRKVDGWVKGNWRAYDWKQETSEDAVDA